MRSGRLLQILMLLQAHGRMSAQRLSQETEVSLRTIHRDIEELSASGVPVVADRGAAGGFMTLQGGATRLPRVTPTQAAAVFTAGSRHPAGPAGRARLDTGLDGATAVVRASPLGLERLRNLNDAMRKAIEQANSKPDKKGWRRVTLPMESADYTSLELLRVGAECEVVSPPELRARI